ERTADGPRPRQRRRGVRSLGRRPCVAVAPKAGRRSEATAVHPHGAWCGLPVSDGVDMNPRCRTTRSPLGPPRKKLFWRIYGFGMLLLVATLCAFAVAAQVIEPTGPWQK